MLIVVYFVVLFLILLFLVEPVDFSVNVVFGKLSVLCLLLFACGNLSILCLPPFTLGEGGPLCGG